MGDERQVDAAILEELRSIVATRSKTDRLISRAWVLLPIAQASYSIAIIVILVVSLSALFGCVFSLPAGSPQSQFQACFSSSFFFNLIGPASYLQLIPFAFGCAYAYLVYLLIKRRNKHFVRIKVLRTDIVAALRAIQRSRDINIEGDLLQADAAAHSADQSEGERNAVIFAFMVFLYGVPYIGLLGFILLLYSFYFLQKDWRRHEEIEDIFFRWVQHAALQVGVQFNYTRTKSIPSRSAALYILGAIFTVGIFPIYWVYTLINDPNGHLKDHAVFEENLVTALATAPAGSVL